MVFIDQRCKGQDASSCQTHTPHLSPAESDQSALASVNEHQHHLKDLELK